MAVVSATQIHLSWQDNSSNEDGFRIERAAGSTSGFTEIATVGPNVTTYHDTGLVEGTTLSYQVRAYNGAGTSAYTNTATATTSLDVSGTWIGSAIQTGASGTLVFQLTQNGLAVTGTYVSNVAGTVSATVSGSILSGTATASYGSCTLTVAFTAQVSGSSMTGTYNGSDSCAGPITNGQFNLNKQSVGGSVDVSGKWTGPGGEGGNGGTFVFKLIQSGQTVSGTFVATDNTTGTSISGTVIGTVSANTFTGTLSGSYASCSVTVTFTAQVSGSFMSGTYSGSNSCTGPVTNGRFTLTKPPAIAFDQTTVSFNATQSAANPAPQVVNVINGGGGTLSGLTLGTISYTAGQPTGWLSASLSSSTAPATLTLSATTATLTGGTYTSTVPVTSSIASNSPQTVGVTFVVSLPPPAIVLSPLNITFTATPGGANPAPQMVTANNGGDGTLSGLSVGTISYGTGEPTGWLSASLSSSTAPATLTLSATTGTLTGAIYTATVPVTSSVASNSPQTLGVTFLISPWIPVASLPTPRGYLAAGVSNGVLYAVGGLENLGGGSSNSSRVDAYDPVTDSWSAKAQTPMQAGAVAVGVVNGVLYAVGGANNSGPTSAVEAYDPVTDSWAAKTPMPTPRANLAVGAVNGVLYAVGGFITPSGGLGSFSSIVEAYDPVTDTWVSKAPMPTPRGFLAVGVLNGVLYAVGGANNHGALSTVEAYDPVTNAWTAKAPMPTPRGHLAVGVLNGVLYAVGGSNSNFSPNVEVYDPVTNSWIESAPLPRPRDGPAVGVVNGVLFAVGGDGSVGLVANVDAYRP